MRLMNVRTKKLHTFYNENIPPYAILSHTWLEDTEEVTFAQIQTPEACQHMLGYQKIEFLCRQAAEDGYEWAWIDTCCIDKTSSAELSEAINSMFAWYREAKVCYAYLADVEVERDGTGSMASGEVSGWLESRWWTRSWTLQEFLAPGNVTFYDRSWTMIGSKIGKALEIEAETGIDVKTIVDSSLMFNCSVAQRMSWAAKRHATRTEDIAYALLGIFEINMPLLYGEGSRAFLRLQQAILQSVNDQSLFAWGF
ncbi:HET-domain-containing protein, partial [Lentithecium fluviatile CBS 122367]